MTGETELIAGLKTDLATLRTALETIYAKVEALKGPYPPPAERGEYAAQTALFDLYQATDLGEVQPSYDHPAAAQGGVPGCGVPGCNAASSAISSTECK